MISRNPLVSEGEYTTENVTVSLNYDEQIPVGYVLQYKINGSEWLEYTKEIIFGGETTWQ